MELAIFVAVQLHAPASRAHPDPAYKECTMLEAELTVSSQRVCSGIMSLYVLELDGSGA